MLRENKAAHGSTFFEDVSLPKVVYILFTLANMTNVTFFFKGKKLILSVGSHDYMRKINVRKHKK